MTNRENTEQEVDEAYRQFEAELVKDLPLAAWGGVIMYTLPGAALLAGLAWFEAPVAYWTPVMLLYLLAALAHMIGEGLQQLLGMIRIHSPVNYDRVRRELSGTR